MSRRDWRRADYYEREAAPERSRTPIDFFSAQAQQPKKRRKRGPNTAETLPAALSQCASGLRARTSSTTTKEAAPWEAE